MKALLASSFISFFSSETSSFLASFLPSAGAAAGAAAMAPPLKDLVPKAFTKCVSDGGRVRTVKPKAGRYMKVCFPKGGGKSVSGEMHKNKKK